MTMFAAFTVFAGGADDVAKWDPRMAADNAVIDTNGVKWIDGKYLPIEGRMYDDVAHYYSRLPDSLTTNVNGGVRSMRTHTSGMLFRFRTDSSFIIVKMAPLGGWSSMGHMTEVGTSGWDVYRRDDKLGKWFFVTSEHGSQSVPAEDMKNGRVKYINWRSGEACIINLPLYNGVAEFRLGIAKGAKIESAGPHLGLSQKPVVFYGTSITHGGCCTRPGLGFVNIVGRDLDVPVVGLGFSGSGKMEFELSDVIARIDASCYVLDCLWNMGDDMVAKRYEPFIRNLRAKRPGVPIVMAEQCDVYCKPPCGKDRIIRKLYAKLITEGWENLVYLPKNWMYPGDGEGTVDGCHPNDLGMRSLATAFGGAVKEALESRRR